MTFYYKSENEVVQIQPPDGGGGGPGEGPPLVIWGPGDPRPTLPIAGWNPGTGTWPEPTPPTPLPPDLIAGWDPMPSQPIAEPPWGWGNPAPKPPIDPLPGWKITYIWLPPPGGGWQVIAIPTKPVPTPSKK